MLRSAIITAAAVLGVGIAVAAGLPTASPASAREPVPASTTGPSPAGPSPNFGCYYQNQNIAAGETVLLTNSAGNTIGYASCSVNDVLDVYYWPT